MPLLYVRNRKQEEISKQFLEGMTFEHNDEEGFLRANKVFPEEEITHVIDRLRPTCASYLPMYEKSEKRVLHLVATHAAIVKCLAVLYGGEM